MQENILWFTEKNKPLDPKFEPIVAETFAFCEKQLNSYDDPVRFESHKKSRHLSVGQGLS